VKKKILIADDQPGGRELLRTILDDISYELIEAGDGIEALEKIRQMAPDLILLDLHMPSLDGFGVVRALRLDPQFATTPVVALTASAMHGDRDKALKAGFTDYIAKPVRVVARLLTRASL
jgi:CheY-like chemotaxis protein